MQNTLNSLRMISLIFKIVANSLSCLSRKIGLTYNEINIVTYYFIIPFSWLVLIDIIFHFHYLKITFGIFTLGFFVGCRNFTTYSDWLFDKSVAFLNYFNKYGSNYIKSSVWICVALPIIIYITLLYVIFR